VRACRKLRTPPKSYGFLCSWVTGTLRAPTEGMPTMVTRPISHESDTTRAAWARTASFGLGILVVYFGVWELAERSVHRLSVGDMHDLHILRGVCAAILVGSWTFVQIRRAWIDTDRELDRRAAELEERVAARTAELVEARRFTEGLLDALRERVVVVDPTGAIVKTNRVAERPCTERGVVVTHADAYGRLWEVERLPLPSFEGRTGLSVEVGRDVTEERDLFAQLCQKEKMASLGLLAAGIAHDLASPLTAIATELELLVEEVAVPAVRSSFEVVRAHVRRMSGMLGEMVGFARRRGDEATDVSIAFAVADSSRLVRHDPRLRRVTMQLDVPEGLPLVRMVEDHLVLVLVNLFLNAADAMPGGGTIAVRARAVDGGRGLTLVVEDTGTGMSEDVLAHATSPLFTTKKAGAGSGLGLFVANRVIAAVGGTLTLTSRKAEGTRVSLFLPAAPL
jgi:C4-dicarboxylate-specific signal transduction histidine kinase